MSDNIKAVNLRREELCGCWRDVVKRKVPKFHTLEDPCGKCGICRGIAALVRSDDGGDLCCERIGQPVLDELGAFVMVDSEEMEDGHCEKHAQELNQRQIAAGEALALGTEEGRQEAARLLGLGHDDPLLLRSGE